MKLSECKGKCEWYYFCYAVANYCSLTGEKLHGTPKSTEEFKSKMIAIGIIESIKRNL